VTAAGTKCGASLVSSGISEMDVNSWELPIVLGQLYLNNHCYTHYYAAGMFGIGRTKEQTILVVNQL